MCGFLVREALSLREIDFFATWVRLTDFCIRYLSLLGFALCEVTFQEGLYSVFRVVLLLNLKDVHDLNSALPFQLVKKSLLQTVILILLIQKQFFLL